MNYAGHIRNLHRRRTDYRDTFGSPQGKRVLADLMRAGGWDNEIAVPGDPFLTHVNIGANRLLKRIVKILAMDESDVAEIAATLKKQEEDSSVEQE